MRWLLSFGAFAVLAAAYAPTPRARAAEPVNFEKEVLPLLEERCLKCHAAEWGGRKRRPKGGLRLDGPGWILRGGNGGRSVVARKPEISLLHARIALPDTHDDVMPPDGDVFDAEQIELIGRWIREGANFGSWKGAGGPAPTKPVATEPKKDTPNKPSVDRFAVYRKLGSDMKAAPGSTIAKVVAAGARVTPVFPGSPLLRVEFVRDPYSVTDKTLEALAPVKRHVAMLTLDLTKVTNKAVGTIAGMPNLVRLDLQRTAIDDKGVEALVASPPRHLKRLNLYGTAVSDASVAALSRLTGLRELFLWQSKVSPSGIRQLRSLLPDCRVQADRELPPPQERRNTNRRRRR